MERPAAIPHSGAGNRRAQGRPMRFWLPSPGRGAAPYAYLGAYLALEWGSQMHSFDFLDIALWNPSPAASLVLLAARGLGYTPLLAVAGLVSSLVVHQSAQSFSGALFSSVMLALGYAALAFALARAGFVLGRGGLRDAACLVVLAPAGALLTALLACGAVLATGDLPEHRFATALTQFWVGDTLGILVAMPAASAWLALRRVRLDMWGAGNGRRGIAADIAVFAAGLGAALWCMFGLAASNDHQFFYLMFLPVIWIAIRQGFAGAAIAILFAQLALLTVTQAVGYAADAIVGLQMLMLTLAATGHLLGASVSDRRRSEAGAKMQQAELARMARNTTAGAMGVALAHQISQPLSTIATHIHVARRLASDGQGASAEIAESLAVAAEEMRRAQHVLGALREFISHGKAQTAPVDLAALVLRLVDILRAEAARHGVGLSFDLAAVPAISADALQIEQVVLNLVTNALEAAAERPDRRGRVVVRTTARPGAARILVEDNGGGIGEDVAAQLYEPFVTTKASGMGLGLALSRQIVVLHGGRLWWEAAQHDGTRFAAELPVARESDG